MNTADKIILLIKLGIRNIIRQKKRSALVMSAAAVGMLGIILTFTFMNGFVDSMIDAGLDTGLGHVQVRPVGYEKSREMGMLLVDAPGVERTLLEAAGGLPPDKRFGFAPRLEREGFLRLGSFIRGVTLVGIRPASEKKISSFDKWIVRGEYLHQASAEDRGYGIAPAMIGLINARKMDVEPGDTAVISLIDTKGDSRAIRVRIQGIFHSTVPLLDKYYVIMRREDLGALYAGDPQATSGFVLRGRRIEDAGWLQRHLRRSPDMARRKDLEILTYKELEPAIPRLIDAFESFRWIVYAIMMIGFALILFESVTMSVYERTREIGILRAMGSRPLFIFAMTMFESALLALSGCAAGFLLSSAITLYFSVNGLSLAMFSAGMELVGKSTSVVYPYITIKDVLTGFLAGLLVSFMAGAYPAFRAVSLVPVKAIYNR